LKVGKAIFFPDRSLILVEKSYCHSFKIYNFLNNIIITIIHFDIFPGGLSFNEEKILGLFFHWK